MGVRETSHRLPEPSPASSPRTGCECGMLHPGAHQTLGPQAFSWGGAHGHPCLAGPSSRLPEGSEYSAKVALSAEFTLREPSYQGWWGPPQIHGSGHGGPVSPAGLSETAASGPHVSASASIQHRSQSGDRAGHLPHQPGPKGQEPPGGKAQSQATCAPPSCSVLMTAGAAPTPPYLPRCCRSDRSDLPPSCGTGGSGREGHVVLAGVMAKKGQSTEHAPEPAPGPAASPLFPRRHIPGTAGALSQQHAGQHLGGRAGGREPTCMWLLCCFFTSGWMHSCSREPSTHTLGLRRA